MIRFVSISSGTISLVQRRRYLSLAVAEEKKRIQVTLPLEIWRDLDDYAKSRGVAKSSMAAIAIAEFLERVKEQK